MLEYNSTGIYLEAENSTKIQGFDSNGNVQNQGLEIGDEIISVNGVNIENNPTELSNILQNSSNDEKLNFTVKRNNEELSIDITPIKQKKYF